MARFVIRSATKFLCGICALEFWDCLSCEEHVLGHFVLRSATGYLCVICAQGFNAHEGCGYHVLMQHSDVIDCWSHILCWIMFWVPQFPPEVSWNVQNFEFSTVVKKIYSNRYLILWLFFYGKPSIFEMNVNQCRRVGNIFWLCLCLLWSALRHQPAVELQEACEGDAPGPWTNQLPLLWNHPHKEWEEQACWTLWCYTYSLVGINDI